MTIVFSGTSISYLINNSSNFIGIDTAFTELTRDNRLFCTREEKIREKNVYIAVTRSCRFHMHGVEFAVQVY